MKSLIQLFFLFFTIVSILKLNAAESSPQFIKGADTLVVYKDVPGLTPSNKYTIRVRSAATNNKWVNVFAHYTYNRALELPDINQANGSNVETNVQHYPKFTGGWSQTYGNIEMSRNQPVEVEIAAINGFKIGGKDFFKATVHPAQKATAPTIVNNKIYFSISNPSQVVIDINGQMDDHNKQIENNPTYVTHTITFFTNPVLKKPSLNGKRVHYVEAGTDSTAMKAIDPSTYDTLYFKPGVHNIGRNHKVFPGKKIYIPGDAIIFGTLNNVDVPFGIYSKRGENIIIYGYGTISGGKITHPLYISKSENANLYKPIMLDNALNYEIYGITIIDPAHHSCFIPGGVGGAIRWAKVVGWRANSDGFAGNDMVNDCFMRTSDDASYVRGSKKRCTFWKDHHSAIFYMAWIYTDRAILIEDCDVVYLRSRYDDGASGGLFNARGSKEAGNPAGVYNVDVTFRNFRIHDRLSNMCVFNMYSFNGASGSSPSSVGYSYNGMKFENVSIAASSVKSVLLGCAKAPWHGGLTFNNVTIGGTKLTQENFSTYFRTNEFVKDLIFK